jgi:hypothetical protein
MARAQMANVPQMLLDVLIRKEQYREGSKAAGGTDTSVDAGALWLPKLRRLRKSQSKRDEES